jgi:hypothetical protein
MAENTRTCALCCTTPQVATDASQVFRYQRDLTEYVYASTITSVRAATTPGYQYQYKSQTERIQALIGRITTPQATALKSNGGQCGQPSSGQ